jgi:hypothetical protein
MPMDQLLSANDELMVERLAEFLRVHHPSLDDILGAACETYRVDPDEIGFYNAAPARRAFCYLAVRWSGVPYTEIGSRVGLDALEVGKAFKSFSRNLDNALVRDDLDLIGIRIAERILLRRRMAR